MERLESLSGCEVLGAALVTCLNETQETVDSRRWQRKL